MKAAPRTTANMPTRAWVCGGWRIYVCNSAASLAWKRKALLVGNILSWKALSFHARLAERAYRFRYLEITSEQTPAHNPKCPSGRSGITQMESGVSGFPGKVQIYPRLVSVASSIL